MKKKTLIITTIFILAIILIYNLLYILNIIPHKKYENADFNIDKADKKIDFRRVRNLRVYFDNHALSLTTDIHEIEEWQGGDIVVFEKHVGVVSDKRNKNGIPFVIHHANPMQKEYEEDILSYRNDIVGHYRISE